MGGLFAVEFAHGIVEARFERYHGYRLEFETFFNAFKHPRMRWCSHKKMNGAPAYSQRRHSVGLGVMTGKGFRKRSPGSLNEAAAGAF